VELTENIARHAGRLATVHTLRGADAVHLASVLAIGVDDTVFAVWDQRLRTAAHEVAVGLAPSR
jgi:predicted nucleic acid-binding protein